MRTPSLRLAIIAALGAAAVFLGGCTTKGAVRVRPWERATLADDTMNPDIDPVGASSTDHVFFSREAASGGRGVGGSGCGCN